LDDRHLGKGEALDRPATAIQSPPAEAPMLTIPDDQWQQVLPKLRKQCPRLTELDLKECQQRIDLLTAKIQNRHWVNRVVARRVVLSLLQTSGGVHAGA
jgi:hypothetical protein